MLVRMTMHNFYMATSLLDMNAASYYWQWDFVVEVQHFIESPVRAVRDGGSVSKRKE